ncbi:MAG: hypothetical protein KatS3mg102_2545 [Planctomycetota bacterium]|nr:MAG: hypothetical protein KatS3mg102_2545 [Planctomycetota bacterium]
MHGVNAVPPRKQDRRCSRAGRPARWMAVLLAAALGAGGCGEAGSSGGGARRPAAPATSGEFDLLTYNVHGLPDSFARGRTPSRDVPLIGPLLNGYTLVLVQEDFWYHDELAAQALHAYRSVPLSGHTTPLNDGLNRFSDLPLGPHVRIPWAACYGLYDAGNDCLAAKGFAVSSVELAAGVAIWVYNLHADAGGGIADAGTRELQFAQLREHILREAAGRALIVAGDTNLHGFDPQDEPVLQDFMAATGLADSCRFLGCGQERIDRVLFRGGADVALQPVLWRIATEFVDASGRDLSDHKAIHVRFRWSLQARP